MDERAASGSTSLPLGDRTESWDAGAAEKSYELPGDANCYFWHDPNGDPSTKAAYKLPFASLSGGKHAVWRAVTAAAQRLSATQLPDADVAGVKAKIAAYYRKARDKYGDDSIQVPWEQSSRPDAELRYAVSPITHVDVRDHSATEDNTWTMSGYAAVFNQTTTLYDGKFLRLTESIAPAAFDRVLREQALGQPEGVVHFNLGHDIARSVAATDVPTGQPGSLELRSDANGLFFLARVPRDDPDGVAMAAKMRSGVLRQASFAFSVAQDSIEYSELEDGPEVEHRTIQDLKHLYDVCATPQGAYAQTVSGLRSLAASLGQPAEGGHPRQPDLGGAIVVSPRVAEGDVGHSEAARRARIRLKRSIQASRRFQSRK